MHTVKLTFKSVVFKFNSKLFCQYEDMLKVI